MKKNLTESFVSINSLAKFLKHLLFISFVLLTLGSCVNFRSGVHPKLVKNVKTYPSTAQGNLSKNDTITALIANEITIEAKRSEVIPSPVLANIPDASKNQFTYLKRSLPKNTAKKLTSKPKIHTKKEKLNAAKPLNNEETVEELDIRQSDNARLFGILAIVSFFSLVFIPLVLIFCPLAFFYGRRVLKRGNAKKGSREYRGAQFGTGIGWAFYVGWALFFVILLLANAGVLF
jgi:hypothetical protein